MHARTLTCIYVQVCCVHTSVSKCIYVAYLSASTLLSVHVCMYVAKCAAHMRDHSASTAAAGLSGNHTQPQVLRMGFPAWVSPGNMGLEGGAARADTLLKCAKAEVMAHTPLLIPALLAAVSATPPSVATTAIGVLVSFLTHFTQMVRDCTVLCRLHFGTNCLRSVSVSSWPAF